MNNWHWVINVGKCNYCLDGIATKTVIFAMKASVNYDNPVTSIHNIQISTANCPKNGATCKGNGDRRRWPSGWTLGFINAIIEFSKSNRHRDLLRTEFLGNTEPP